MLYDRAQRRVSFWRGATNAGDPTTVIGNLPDQDLAPWVSTYENSVKIRDERWARQVEPQPVSQVAAPWDNRNPKHERQVCGCADSNVWRSRAYTGRRNRANSHGMAPPGMRNTYLGDVTACPSAQTVPARTSAMV